MFLRDGEIDARAILERQEREDATAMAIIECPLFPRPLEFLRLSDGSWKMESGPAWMHGGGRWPGPWPPERWREFTFYDPLRYGTMREGRFYPLDRRPGELTLRISSPVALELAFGPNKENADATVQAG